MPTGRVDAVDGLRGLALCAMIIYHFCFDLNWFGFIHADPNHDPVWLGARACIVSTFLLIVGISLVLSESAGATAVHFWRRVALVAGCALLVTAASYVLFPATVITFGILHFIAVASVIARPLARRPQAAFAAAVAILLLAQTVQSPLFDTPWLDWIGFTTHKPATEDYVPLLPWLGVVCIGIVFGKELLERNFTPLAFVNSIAPRWTRWLGRHSLLVYMVHQPLLVGLLRALHG
jgi:uncharacterized membrane protein